MRLRLRTVLAITIVVALGGATWLEAVVVPRWGANKILHPPRRSAPPAPDVPYSEVRLRGDGITLVGWRFPAIGERRGLVVYLHGISDDRRGGIAFARWFTPHGFDVLALDQRAHGESGGDACTYGVLERRDVSRVLDAEPPGPVVLYGGSLGGAVALQTAADDPRVACVVAVAPFSDLRTAVHERAPFFVPDFQFDWVLDAAAREAHFDVDAASPLAAAKRIRVPVLLIHGANDRATPPDHSLRIFDALRGPKERIVVPNVGHDGDLDRATWDRIGATIEALGANLPRAPEPR